MPCISCGEALLISCTWLPTQNEFVPLPTMPASRLCESLLPVTAVTSLLTTRQFRPAVCTSIGPPCPPASTRRSATVTYFPPVYWWVSTPLMPPVAPLA